MANDYQIDVSLVVDGNYLIKKSPPPQKNTSVKSEEEPKKATNQILDVINLTNIENGDSIKRCVRRYNLMVEFPLGR